MLNLQIKKQLLRSERGSALISTLIGGVILISGGLLITKGIISTSTFNQMTQDRQVAGQFVNELAEYFRSKVSVDIISNPVVGNYKLCVPINQVTTTPNPSPSSTPKKGVGCSRNEETPPPPTSQIYKDVVADLPGGVLRGTGSRGYTVRVINLLTMKHRDDLCETPIKNIVLEQNEHFIVDVYVDWRDPQRVSKRETASVLIPQSSASSSCPAPIVISNTSINARTRPLTTCSPSSPSPCTPWPSLDTTSNVSPAKLIANGLQPGWVVSVSGLGGKPIEWMGTRDTSGDAVFDHWLADPPCLNGADSATGKGFATLQFADDNDRILAVTDRPNGVILVRDVARNGVVVPVGATKLYGSFPDDSYGDNFCGATQISPAPSYGAFCATYGLGVSEVGYCGLSVTLTPPCAAQPPLAQPRTQRIFVTSRVSAGFSSSKKPAFLENSDFYDRPADGIPGMNEFCNDSARGAGLTGNWKAVVSTGTTNAKDRIAISGLVHDLKGNLIAKSGTDFWENRHERPIMYNEYGGANWDPDVWYQVWTGTTTGGVFSGGNRACNDWSAQGSTPNTEKGEAGKYYGTFLKGTLWTQALNGFSLDCFLPARVYCIEDATPEPIVVPTPTPTPTACSGTLRFSGDPFEIRTFVNDKSGSIIMPVVPQASAALFDDATASKVCELAGKPVVVSKDSFSSTYGSSGFSRSWENLLVRWDAGTSQWISQRADRTTPRNTWLAQLTCGCPAAPTPTPSPTPAPGGSCDPAAPGGVIDFEKYPSGANTQDNQIVNTQWKATHGVTFCFDSNRDGSCDSGNPKIAKVGGAKTAFSSNAGNDTPRGSNASLVGASFITAGDNNENPILVRYDNPVSAVSGYVIDIADDAEHEEVWIEALGADYKPISGATVHLEEGDPQTGDGVPTPWSIQRATAEIWAIRLRGTDDGLAFDNFSPSTVCNGTATPPPPPPPPSGGGLQTCPIIEKFPILFVCQYPGTGWRNGTNTLTLPADAQNISVRVTEVCLDDSGPNVTINGTQIMSSNTQSNGSHCESKNIDISSLLRAGANTIDGRVYNHPSGAICNAIGLRLSGSYKAADCTTALPAPPPSSCTASNKWWFNNYCWNL